MLLSLVAATTLNAQLDTARRTNTDALKIGNAVPNNCELKDVPLKGTELRYYPPFSPSDGVLDAWCKLQTLKSDEPIKVYLVTQEQSTPLVKSTFHPDGSVHSTKAMFAYDLVNAIQDNGGVYLSRALKVLETVGFPKDSPEGSYRFYEGSLQMELGGVDIFGLPFTVVVYFNANPALIGKHFDGTSNYLHVPVADSRGVKREVGFPWKLAFVQLSSNDRRTKMATPEISRLFVQRYGKWITKADVAEPEQGDKDHRTTEVDDGLIKVNLHQGKRKAEGDAYLEMNYMASPKGQYNSWLNANVDFEKFKSGVVERQRQSVVNGMKAAEKKNPDPFK
jgi:hypothetical protein